MTETASESRRVSRISILHVIVLVIVGVAAFAAGYLSAGFTDTSPEDPALGMARDTGHAIPLEQYWAFEDGVITFEEVAQAGDNFSTCAQQAGVDGFVLKINESGWEASHSNGDNETFAAVATCQRVQFLAIYDVFRRQQLPTGG